MKEANSLDLNLEVLLGHDLRLKKEEEEDRKLSLSAYRTTTKKRTQSVVTTTGRGSFPLGGFMNPNATFMLMEKESMAKNEDEEGNQRLEGVRDSENGDEEGVCLMDGF